jgi:hypothetical protein
MQGAFSVSECICTTHPGRRIYHQRRCSWHARSLLGRFPAVSSMTRSWTQQRPREPLCPCRLHLCRRHLTRRQQTMALHQLAVAAAVLAEEGVAEEDGAAAVLGLLLLLLLRKMSRVRRPPRAQALVAIHRPVDISTPEPVAMRELQNEQSCLWLA